MYKNIAIAIILLLNLGLLYQLKQKNKVHQTVQALAAQQTSGQTAAYSNDSYVVTKYWWEMHSHGEQIAEVQLLGDLSETEDTFSLSDLVGDRPKLVLRYSELHCDVCVDSTLNKIKNFAKEIGAENILLLSSYANPRDMYTFKRLNQIELPLYNLGDQTLGLPAEQAETPYLFILHPDQKAEKVYLFYKEISDHIDKYFDIVRTRYFDV